MLLLNREVSESTVKPTEEHSRPEPFETFSRFAAQMTIPCFTAARLGSGEVIYKSDSSFVRHRRTILELRAPSLTACVRVCVVSYTCSVTLLSPFLARFAITASRATKKDNTRGFSSSSSFLSDNARRAPASCV